MESSKEQLAAPADKLIGRVWHYCTDILPTAAAGVSWREFFEASQRVARLNSPESGLMTFDMDALSPQTFACVVLEVWASEMTRDCPFKHERGMGELPECDLGKLVTTQQAAFFRTWLLLGEVLRPTQILDARERLITRPAPNRAVVERHWYSTASQIAKEPEMTRDVVPGRLPGGWTTRGDWFLTIGPESRSRRLGERAIDLLCRRRDNVSRLDLGIGLPVRDLRPTEASDDEFNKTLETALEIIDCKTALPCRMTYEQLLCLTKVSKTMSLRYLWRSQIPRYYRCDRVFEHWIGRFVASAAAWNRQLKGVGINGFVAYDSKSGCVSSVLTEQQSVELAKAEETCKEMCRAMCCHLIKFAYSGRKDALKTSTPDEECEANLI